MADSRIRLPNGDLLQLPNPLNLPNLNLYLNDHASVFNSNFDSDDSRMNVSVDDSDISKLPVIYVIQGEIAHSSSNQYSKHGGAILVSDEATTCHILSLHTTNTASIEGNRHGFHNCDQYVTTLCHIDDTCYFNCLRNAVEIHLQKLCSHSTPFHHDTINHDSNHRFEMDIHIVGGYCDTRQSSFKITEFLLRSLSKISFEYSNILNITLRTCFVGALNTSTYYNTPDTSTCNIYDIKQSSLPQHHVDSRDISCPITQPIVRGLAIDTLSGKIRLIPKVHPSFRGPDLTLRHVRLYSENTSHTLSPIHFLDQEKVIIQPFLFSPLNNYVKFLLPLSDQDLLKYVSTSPDAEDDDFCDQVRKNVTFTIENNATEIFGSKIDTPIVYLYCYHSSVELNNNVGKMESLSNWIKI